MKQEHLSGVSTQSERVDLPRRGTQTARWLRVNELGVVYLFLGLLVLFVVIGALLPKYFPGVIRKLDSTVLKEPKEESRH